MPLGLTYDQAALVDPYLTLEPPVEEVATPQSVLGLPPPMPTTSYFAPRGGYRSPYGGSRTQDPYEIQKRANALRLEQAMEQQAAQLFQEFKQVDSASPDYPRIREQLALKYPMATRHPAGKALIDSADFRFQQTQRQNPNQSFIQRAAMSGVTPEEIAQFTGPDGTVDYVSLGNLAGERQRASRTQPRDREIMDLHEAYKALEDSGAPKAVKDQFAAMIVQKTNAKFGGAPAQAVAPATPSAPRVQIKSITPLE